MEFFNKIYAVISQTYSITRNETKGNKIRMLLTYWKIILKYLLTNFLKVRFKNESFLGFSVKILDYTQFCIMFKEIFVERVYKFKSDKKTPVIIDCGSNIGMSILFFKYIYPNCKIIGFEPDPKAFAALQENLQKNNIDAEVKQIALAETKGKLAFFTPSNEEGSWASTTVKTMIANPHYWKRRKVHAEPLSDYISKPIDMLKIDVEGAEGCLLRDLAKHQKLKHIKRIVMEYHHNPKDLNSKLDELLKIIRNYGFSYSIKPINSFVCLVYASRH